MATDPEQSSHAFHERIKTRNPKMQRLIEYAEAVAATPYAVLLEGETGTGKELFARGIHAASKRPGPFVPINCGAVPESMFEAELFGARRGAYTGQYDERPGLFKVADRGTLFLDEVGDLPPSVQSKLLRVLEDGEIRPLGAAEAVRVDVRIIAATHKYLKPLVDNSLFRRDLYFRLSAACIRIPPVRERTEDIQLLVDAAVEAACRLQGRSKVAISEAVMSALQSYPWPGNVREMNNVIATAVLRSEGDRLRPSHLSGTFGAAAEPGGTPTNTADRPFFDALQEFESRYLRDLLRSAGRNLSEAARISGLSRSAVRSKARAYGLIADGADDTQPVPRSRVRKPTRH